MGLAAATVVAPGTTGCIYHDTCIKVTSPGHDYCRNVALAKMWPVGGSFEDALALEVRVKRGTQWLDFTYTFVP